MRLPCTHGFAGALVAAMTLLVFVGPASAQSREVSGQLGILGEWEIGATVTEQVNNGAKQLIGPLSLKHVGICSVDGPEEKTGELRLRISSSLASVDATLLIEGTECTFSGKLKESYEGILNCPDRRAMPISLWIK
jgi:hypothetical protein